MEASLDTSLSLHPFRPRLSYRSTVSPTTNPAFFRHRRFKLPGARNLVNRHFALTPISVDSHRTISDEPLNVYETLVRVTASALLFLGLGVRVCLAAPTGHQPVPAGDEQTLQEELNIQENDEGKFNNVQKIEDGKMDAAFETWKSKTFALSVPLRVVVLNGSIPPSWLKELLQSQGRRLRFSSKYAASLEKIFSDLSSSCNKGNFGPTSTMAADLVSVGDSWLNFAIKGGLIEPIKGIEDQDWYTGLSEKWKAYLRRNCEGGIDPKGEIWAAPYRWGTMVIAYKKSKFKKYKIAPIEDWADLWRPELAGKISMVDSPREVVGAVLKYMGASYNTKNIDTEVAGGRSAVQKNLALLGKQVRLFDSIQYIKAFGVGDVWVAVGWSSDILPAAKRMSNIAVVVPKSGASLWADLWAVPAASRFKTNQIGGRVRGPSPLIHQWIEFCLQPARALPFKQEVIPGAVPSALENVPAKLPEELTKGKPRLDTNLVAGVPPPDILARCEFLEPLPDAVVSDYKWLISRLQKPALASTHWIHQYISSMIQTFCARGSDKSNVN